MFKWNVAPSWLKTSSLCVSAVKRRNKLHNIFPCRLSQLLVQLLHPHRGWLHGFLHHWDRCEARGYPLSLPHPSCHWLCYAEGHGPRWLWDTLASINTPDGPQLRRWHCFVGWRLEKHEDHDMKTWSKRQPKWASGLAGTRPRSWELVTWRHSIPQVGQQCLVEVNQFTTLGSILAGDRDADH